MAERHDLSSVGEETRVTARKRMDGFLLRSGVASREGGSGCGVRAGNSPPESGMQAQNFTDFIQYSGKNTKVKSLVMIDWNISATFLSFGRTL